MQRSCTEKTRYIAAKTCSLQMEFIEAHILNERRESEFANCVGRESLAADKKIKGYEAMVLPSISGIKSCKVKCEEITANSHLTGAVRQKNSAISRKVIGCKAELRKIMKLNYLSDRISLHLASAALTTNLQNIARELRLLSHSEYTNNMLNETSHIKMDTTGFALTELSYDEKKNVKNNLFELYRQLHQKSVEITAISDKVKDVEGLTNINGTVSNASVATTGNTSVTAAHSDENATTAKPRVKPEVNALTRVTATIKTTVATVQNTQASDEHYEYEDDDERMNDLMYPLLSTEPVAPSTHKLESLSTDATTSITRVTSSPTSTTTISAKISELKSQNGKSVKNFHQRTDDNELKNYPKSTNDPEKSIFNNQISTNRSSKMLASKQSIIAANAVAPALVLANFSASNAETKQRLNPKINNARNESSEANKLQQPQGTFWYITPLEKKNLTPEELEVELAKAEKNAPKIENYNKIEEELEFSSRLSKLLKQKAEDKSIRIGQLKHKKHNHTLKIKKIDGQTSDRSSEVSDSAFSEDHRKYLEADKDATFTSANAFNQQMLQKLRHMSAKYVKKIVPPKSVSENFSFQSLLPFSNYATSFNETINKFNAATAKSANENLNINDINAESVQSIATNQISLSDPDNYSADDWEPIVDLNNQIKRINQTINAAAIDAISMNISNENVEKWNKTTIVESKFIEDDFAKENEDHNAINNDDDDDESTVARRRLQILHNPNAKANAENGLSGYCGLYTVCITQLNYEENECTEIGENGRLVPGLPGRRVGQCNEELVQDFQEMDMLKLQLQQIFLSCLGDAINEELNKSGQSYPNITTKCSTEYPALAEFPEYFTCFQRLRMMQIYCKKLADCCEQVNPCNNRAKSSLYAETLKCRREENLCDRLLRHLAMKPIQRSNTTFSVYQKAF
uniref:Protein kinase domain-containing protein n=1 Tax=Syphacia muris TaxID=451379 RepID=A0A0N5ARJ9_9BILA